MPVDMVVLCGQETAPITVADDRQVVTAAARQADAATLHQQVDAVADAATHLRAVVVAATLHLVAAHQEAAVATQAAAAAVAATRVVAVAVAADSQAAATAEAVVTAVVVAATVAAAVTADVDNIIPRESI